MGTTTEPDPNVEPKHRQLKTVLTEALESEFAVGQILPNERELAARFGVARATLRQALEQLELEGVARSPRQPPPPARTREPTGVPLPPSARRPPRRYPVHRP